MVTDEPHEWVYRGQIIQKNRHVEEGYLKVDGLFIYQMKNFGLRLVAV